MIQKKTGDFFLCKKAARIRRGGRLAPHRASSELPRYPLDLEISRKSTQNSDILKNKQDLEWPGMATNHIGMDNMDMMGIYGNMIYTCMCIYI